MLKNLSRKTIIIGAVALLFVALVAPRNIAIAVLAFIIITISIR